jgi:hypothetical protein
VECANDTIVRYLFLRKAHDERVTRSNLTDCQTFLEKNQLDPIIGNRSMLMHFRINLIEPVFLPSIILLFFCISEKLWYKTCCPSPGSLGRNLTGLPPRRIITRVYVGIHISQGKIHHQPRAAILPSCRSCYEYNGMQTMHFI